MRSIFLSAVAFAVAANAATRGFLAPGEVPSFIPTATYTVPGAVMVAVADVNRDGNPDLITANGANGAALLLGNADGTFQPVRALAAGSTATFVVTGDFNGDGNIDLAFADTTFNSGVSLVSVYLGNGDATFRRAADITPGGLSVNHLTAADFNNDGKTDLAISTLTSVSGINGNIVTYNLTVMLGQAGGAFLMASSTPTNVGNSTLNADFNGDGRQDLLVLGASQIKIGNGDGTFTDGQVLPASTYFGVAVDGNNDGRMDLHILTGGRTRSGPIAYTFTGNGDGTFIFGGTFGAIFGTTLVNPFVAADFNGDGRPDFVTLWGATDNQNSTLGPWGGPIGWGVNPNIGNKWFAAADFDHNGAPDLAMVDGANVYIARNTMGNPPLLGLLTLNSTYVVGGSTSVTGTVSIGAPAPAAGLVVTLATSNPSAAFPLAPTVTIPAGATSAPFTLTTRAVAATSPVTVSATLGSVTLTGAIQVLAPIAVSSITVAPASLPGFFGGNLIVATITLSGPASDNTVVTLASSNPTALTVPATVPFVPGTTSAQVQLSAFNVNANTPVTVTAGYQGTAATAVVNVLKATDTVTITKTEYTVSKSQFKLEAASSDPATAFLRVLNATTGAFIGTMTPAGGGKFTGQFIVLGGLTNVAVQSSNGGLATSPVVQK